MKSLISQLHQRFRKAIVQAYPQLEQSGEAIPLDVTQSTNAKFGDYQCNSAMKLAKPLGLNPRAAAQEIINHLDCASDGTNPFISKVEIAGPGFINVWICP
jgi:arginyl-tRNA synthetase